MRGCQIGGSYSSGDAQLITMRKMEEQRTVKKIKMILCVLPFMLLAGCGNLDAMEVMIEDGQVTTVVSVESGSTVGDILDEAELELTPDDEISPAVTETVDRSDTVIMISRKNNVTITEDGEAAHTITVMGGTVSDALSKAGITIGKYDEIDHDLQAYLKDGMSIDIIHKIEITLTVDGDSSKVITSAKTVGDLLAEQDITVGERDRISKEKSAELVAGDNVAIERVDVRKITETEAIAYETETEYSDDMYEDESSTKQEGVDGEKKLTYDVTYVDGKESTRKLVSEKITRKPVNEIIVQGTRQREAEPSSNGDSGKTIVSKEKNYDCDGSGHGWYTITYSDGSVEYIDF